jgi:hypothetical protein
MQKIVLGFHQINIILCNFLSQSSSLGSNPDINKKKSQQVSDMGMDRTTHLAAQNKNFQILIQ